jgi:magnesium-transporting ATPase (P-type)
MGKAIEAVGAAAPWVRTAQQVAQDLEVSTSSGLSAAQVEQRRQQYGYNELAKEEATPLWKLVLEQFNDMLVKVSWWLWLWAPHSSCAEATHHA